MNLNEFNKFCILLPMTAYIVQWRGSHVWKVGEKVFAIGRWGEGKNTGITFKVSEIAFECLKDEPGLRPAPYFASRGMTWLQYYEEQDYTERRLSHNDLKSLLAESHRIVSLGLTKKNRKNYAFTGNRVFSGLTPRYVNLELFQIL